MPARNDQLRAALRNAASALKEHGPRFALGGSYALWVYGAPEPVHDVDLVVAEVDVEASATTLAKAGFTIDRTPEDWLFKACTDDVVVDVLHRLNGVPVDAEVLHSAVQLDVLAIRMPVLSPTAVVVEKLRALNEHNCDFGPLLPAVRAVRERLDWALIRAQTVDNDFAVAFLVLTKRLGIAP
ncbi:MAG TPA: nucleotidyltransferase [Mycobacterium sp.]|jgi:predicted nucleotidyltransferase|nr:nucleotidyltransferase [Mycobacterium sp.]